MSGDNNTFFDAFELVKNFKATKEKNIKKKKEKSRGSKFLNRYFKCCANQEESNSDEVDEIEKLKK